MIRNNEKSEEKMKTPQVTPDWKTGIYIGNGQIVSDTTAEQFVESLARMSDAE